MYKVGDKFSMEVEEGNVVSGTILDINGVYGLIDWDPTIHSWGVNKPKPSWVNLKTKSFAEASSLVSVLTKGMNS